MKFLDAAQNRYATKLYDNSKKIDSKKMEELKQILHLSPSSINGQPWQFTFVHDTEMKAKLAEASFFNADRIKDCDTLVVFSSIDNIDLFEKQITEHLVEGAVNYFNTVVKPLGDVFVKNWFQKQVYLSLGIFLGACATMEIDATPMEGIEPDKYDALINPNGNYTALFGVAVGYRNPEDSFQPIKKPKERVEFDKIIRSI
ncbi:NAD(P)H-dependent oxidoreductase [Bernardetia sp. MNP-M8]|uniref:NAD(P)H-dependent oxidoreductase n=1 Tax=Bernardetia sp. MNP-M8 TaxID=3127470 RepID=UPI0030D1797C